MGKKQNLKYSIFEYWLKSGFKPHKPLFSRDIALCKSSIYIYIYTSFEFLPTLLVFVLHNSPIKPNVSSNSISEVLHHNTLF
ncbi:hypothetical protein CROQUDRAFT_428166 [Cronartium quercuum f. sp. fusiforme G11]|uniref:Uncharacterized protein n=1 Tax=Cronartium quercuum f. sp. fusiforme G11 TaxID=708437 RepID=A0A9P6NPT3_9BASI|nr:hypothetical protein CROQUDRAFT_428166 [Cronartium quercuum f. sp. fusiforme G11]